MSAPYHGASTTAAKAYPSGVQALLDWTSGRSLRNAAFLSLVVNVAVFAAAMRSLLTEVFFPVAMDVAARV